MDELGRTRSRLGSPQVSLGTAYNDRPDFYRTVLRTAADRPWQVVPAVGETDPKALGPVPPNVERNWGPLEEWSSASWDH